MDQVAKLLDAIDRLANVLIWPAVIVMIVRWFREPLTNFLNKLNEGRLKVFGIEAVLKAQSEVAAALTSAEADRSGLPVDAVSTNLASTVSQSFRSASDLVSASTLHKLDAKQLLWVDDNPSSNFYEHRAINALGIRVISARSTNEAIALLGTSGQGYDAIISDMGRPEGSRAGYDLLAQLKATGISKPFIIYSGSNTSAQAKEAKQNGAFGSTDKPVKLLNLVVGALA